MTLVAGAVFFAGYSLAWWGWLAATDRVNPGAKDTFWWPSIRDLMAPGRQAQAVPPKVTRPGGTLAPETPETAAAVKKAVDAGGIASNPIDVGGSTQQIVVSGKGWKKLVG